MHGGLADTIVNGTFAVNWNDPCAGRKRTSVRRMGCLLLSIAPETPSGVVDWWLYCDEALSHARKQWSEYQERPVFS